MEVVQKGASVSEADAVDMEHTEYSQKAIPAVNAKSDSFQMDLKHKNREARALQASCDSERFQTTLEQKTQVKLRSQKEPSQKMTPQFEDNAIPGALANRVVPKEPE